jgi:hypothetical protein
MSAHRRLREMKRLCGPGEAAELDEHAEYFNLM